MSQTGALYPAGEQVEVFEAFSRALKREAHILTQHPGMLWQQLYNRLHWEGEKVEQVLRPELEQRNASSARPWLKLLSPYQESESLVRTLEGHESSIFKCAFSPDGRNIVSASADKTLRVWDVATGQTVHKLEGHTDWVNSCTFSPDSRYILSSSKDQTIRIWETATGQLLSMYPCKTSSGVYHFSPDGLSILRIGGKMIQFWEPFTGTCLRKIEGPTGMINSSPFSPDGRLLITFEDKSLSIWESGTGHRVRTLIRHTGRVYDCRFSPDGELIVSASEDKTLKIHHAANGKTLRTLEGHAGDVNACAFSPDGQLLVSASKDNTLRIWEVATGRLVEILRGHTNWVNACAFSPDGQNIISASTDKTLLLWNVNTGKKPGAKNVLDAELQNDRYSPDGRLIVSASKERLLIYNSSSGEQLQTIRGQTNIKSCIFSPDGRVLAAICEKPVQEYSLQLYDVASGKVIRTIDRIGMITACVFSPDGRSFVLSSTRLGYKNTQGFKQTDNKLQLRDFATGELLRTMEGHSDLPHVFAFSPDGASVISGSWDKTVRVWDPLTGKNLYTLTGHSGYVNAGTFSPDGTQILSASDDQSIRIWATGATQETKILPGHNERVNACAYSPDGRYIFSSSYDRTLRVWDSLNGDFLFSLFLPGRVESLDRHPFLPQLVCGIQGGTSYRIQMMGIEYGPIIITASQEGQLLTISCPACRQEHPVSGEQLGSSLTCPNPTCSLGLKLNTFVLKPSPGVQ